MQGVEGMQKLGCNAFRNNCNSLAWKQGGVDKCTYFDAIKQCGICRLAGIMEHIEQYDHSTYDFSFRHSLHGRISGDDDESQLKSNKGGD
ncbi:hypothetical protein JHK87_030928 [Glycine soja]|nr:hypothetical protein JHK87_030928 [Glycine soja]